MSFTRAWSRRLIALTAAAFLIAAPVARAFAANLTTLSRHESVAGHADKTAARVAVRAPRVRRPKQSALAAAHSGPSLPVPSVRRAAPAASRSASAPSRAALPDHPPA